MPWSLYRYQREGHLHFITFSCYRRQPKLDPSIRTEFERVLERMRRRYEMTVFGYVVMPEHVHLLVSEPDEKLLSAAIKAMKLAVAHHHGGRFWENRYYDLNVWSDEKAVEKLRYMHRNPVKRGLVTRPEDWQWSSFRHYLTRTTGIVEIQSDWAGNARDGTLTGLNYPG